jgi:Tfp pilus assembly protein PilN
MKAVNLIPPDAAGPRAGGATGIAPFALIGALAAALVMAALWTVTGNTVDRKQRELAQVTAEAQATETQAASYKTYTEFADMRKARVETVTKLAEGRHDWSKAMHEVARTLPSGTWIRSLRATSSSSVAVDGTADQMRGALPVPAVELAGCAPTQSGVAKTLSSLRRMSGVQRVTLTSSVKAAGGATTDTRAAGATGCGTNPQFSLTVFLEAEDKAAGSSTTTGGTTP